MQMKLAATPTLSYSLIGVAAVASIVASLAGVAAIFGILPSAQFARYPEPSPPHDGVARQGKRAVEARDDGNVAVAGKHVAVRAVSQTAPTVAAVAGGAVVGRQPARGTGRTALGVLGAVGGAFPGNARDGDLRSHSRYHASVLMEDGARRSSDSAGPSAFAKGEAIRVVEAR